MRETLTEQRFPPRHDCLHCRVVKCVKRSFGVAWEVVMGSWWSKTGQYQHMWRLWAETEQSVARPERDAVRSVASHCKSGHLASVSGPAMASHPVWVLWVSGFDFPWLTWDYTSPAIQFSQWGNVSADFRTSLPHKTNLEGLQATPWCWVTSDFLKLRFHPECTYFHVICILGVCINFHLGKVVAVVKNLNCLKTSA